MSSFKLNLVFLLVFGAMTHSLSLVVLSVSIHISIINAQTCLTSPPELNHDPLRDVDESWTEIDSTTFSHSIVFDAHTIEIADNDFNTKVTTKLFDGHLPSQTIRMRRGMTYEVEVINNLGPESEYNPATWLDDGSYNNVWKGISFPLLIQCVPITQKM